MILLFEYFGECTIRVRISQSHFSIFGCLLFYNSLIFDPILLSFCKGYLLCLVYLHNNFQLIPLCLQFVWYWPKFYLRKIDCTILPRSGYASYLCCLLLYQFLTTKRHSLMFNLATYWFSSCSSRWLTL